MEDIKKVQQNGKNSFKKNEQSGMTLLYSFTNFTKSQK